MEYSITDIEDAIIDALKASVVGSYCQKIESFQFAGGDEEEEIRLLAKTLPCVLIVYKGGDYKNLQMVTDRTMTFWLLAAAQSLRSPLSSKEARRKTAGTYQMLDDIRTALMAHRLGLQIDPLSPQKEEALINAKGFSAYYIEVKTRARYAMSTGG